MQSIAEYTAEEYKQIEYIQILIHKKDENAKSQEIQKVRDNYKGCPYHRQVLTVEYPD